MSQETVIRLENLSREFKVNHLQGWRQYLSYLVGKSTGEKIIRALDCVTLNIHHGEKVGLIGLNGAGKSTLVKCLTGILRPTSGKSFLFGQDSYRYRQHNNARIGVVFGQRCQLRWDLSPMESYRLLAAMYGISRNDCQESIDRLVELLGLRDFIHQPVRSLSLGQKMRSELASAFLHNPDIVILDEPTLGLDMMAKERIWTFLKNCDKTILMTSHDISDIEEVCARVVVLNNGKILFDGCRETLAAKLGTPGRAVFEFGNENIVFDATQFDANDIRLLSAEPHNAEFALRNSRMLPSLINHLTADNHIIDIQVFENDLKQLVKRLYDSA
ncbi:MAG: ATP-binding cassette domain-containing protein [Elusimicrobiales bacterium]|nr:ATP-binding cassette domain-containing protein [Elusimicrobiales bacterium]